MAAKIQAEKTPIKKTVISRRATLTVFAVFVMHAAMLTALANLTPPPMHRPEPPPPIAVRFVQIAPSKPIEQPTPKPEKPTQQKPKQPPKKLLEPKKVNVVKAPPKPVLKPMAVAKPTPVLSTNTTSKQKQDVTVPVVTTEESKSKPEPETQVATVQKAEPESKTDPKPLAPPAPVLVEGVSYIKPPRLSITERDLKGQARTIKLRINIGANGKVEAVQIVSSSGIAATDQKVANALKKATFTPHRVNGIAVPVYIIQPLELNLPN